ncbi:hypothetical protein BVX98_01910 [bacterium F11]|nr:hypothetical protein BVX98_01910 [bacterium F11]
MRPILFKTSLMLVLILSFFGFIHAKEKVKIKERGRTIKVWASAPIPEEVTNQTQAMALSREAAIVVAQTQLLNYIDKKKVKSGKTVEVMEVAYHKLESEIKGLVKGAKVLSTKWKEGRCWVKLAASRRDLKVILKKY